MIKCKLGDLIEFQRGYDLPKSKANGGKYKIISSNGILAYHNQYKSEASVVIGRSGTVGKPQLIQEKFWPHNTTLFVKDFKDNNIIYIYYLLLKINIEKMKSGSNIPTLNRNHLHPLEIVAEESIYKQQKIANILKIIDDKINNNNKINTELEAMAKTVYDYWFLQYEYPNEEGKPYKSSGGKMVWNEELKKEIPDGWKLKKIVEIEDNIVTGKTPSTKDETNFGGEIPFVTIDDIRKGMYISKTERTLSKKGADLQKNKYIPANSLCITCIATVGLVGITTRQSQTNQQINSIICKNTNNIYFLLNAIRNYFKFSTGAKSGNIFDNMNKEDFSNIKLIYPNKNIIDKYAQKVKPVYDKIRENFLENEELTSLRDYLLPLLMNGQVGFKN